jgi:hypothetical protein
MVSSEGSFWPGGSIDFHVKYNCLDGRYFSEVTVEPLLDETLRAEGLAWPRVTGKSQNKWGEQIQEMCGPSLQSCIKTEVCDAKTTLRIPESGSLVGVSVPFRVSGRIQYPQKVPGQSDKFENVSQNVDETLQIALRAPPPGRVPDWVLPIILCSWLIGSMAMMVPTFWIVYKTEKKRGQGS